jgi:hypothetical protein
MKEGSARDDGEGLVSREANKISAAAALSAGEPLLATLRATDAIEHAMKAGVGFSFLAGGILGASAHQDRQKRMKQALENQGVTYLKGRLLVGLTTRRLVVVGRHGVIEAPLERIGRMTVEKQTITGSLQRLSGAIRKSEHPLRS